MYEKKEIQSLRDQKTASIRGQNTGEQQTDTGVVESTNIEWNELGL